MTLCSIVIGTRQRLRFLEEALASALGQEGVDVEVIVVANGSTDGTAGYLKGLEDGRVRPLIYEEALGSTRARNAGLEAARGDWVGFLDDDDLWAPGKLRSEIDAAEATGRSWAYSGCVYIDERCEIVGGQPPPSPEEVARISPVRYAVPGGISSMIWRRGLLQDGGLLEPRITYPADWDLSLRLLRTGLPAAVEQPLVAHREHRGNMSLRADRYFGDLAVIEEKFADLRQGRHLDVGYQYRNAGSELARAGQRRQALRYYLKAMKLGDRGAVLRAAGLLMPAQTWPWLRRLLLSNGGWLRRAEEWLGPHRATHQALAAAEEAASSDGLRGS